MTTRRRLWRATIFLMVTRALSVLRVGMVIPSTFTIHNGTKTGELCSDIAEVGVAAGLLPLLQYLSTRKASSVVARLCPRNRIGVPVVSPCRAPGGRSSATIRRWPHGGEG